MNVTALNRHSLSRLIGLQTGGQAVLSLYVDLDPVRFPHVRDRRAQVDSLLAQVDREHRDGGRFSREARGALRDDLDQVRAFLSDEELSAPSAHGLAIFCSGPSGIFEVVTLPDAVEPTAVVASRPFIEPIAEVGLPERWCVLLVSRRASRILRGTRDALAAEADLLDDVHGQHAQGGWSQSRFQRGIEHEVDDHIRGTCALLYEGFQRRPFDRLLVAAPAELYHRVEHELHADLRRRLAGHIEVDVERASPDEVRQRALPAIEAAEREHEGEVLERLLEGVAPGGHASVGLDEVLELLNERRVRTLVVADGFTPSGFVCPRCGWLSASAGTCPADGVASQPDDNTIESAIESALGQAADVLIVRHDRDRLVAHGSIGALVGY